jgi:hypothetical protein
MPDTIEAIILSAVGGLLSAALALLLRFLFRWPWVWAFVAGFALVVASTELPIGFWGMVCRFAVNAVVAAISVVMLRRGRGWHWTMALAAGVALFVVLSALNFPIETHAVVMEMPRPQ